MMGTPSDLISTTQCCRIALPHIFDCSWNKYTQIASRAVRQALQESERVAAEKRAAVNV